jgi:hypothetical protein
MLDTSDTRIVHCPFGGQQIATHDAIWDIMYALARKNEHAIWKEQWYALTSGVSLQVDIYMTWEDQVFVVNVVVTNSTWETMVLNVISRPTCAIAKLSTIAKIRKYKRF